MIFEIKHNYREELYIPLLAIKDNMEFLKDTEQNIITADNINCKVTKLLFVNPLSEEGLALIKRIYKVPLESFLLRWYKSVSMQGLLFCWIKIEKI